MTAWMAVLTSRFNTANNRNANRLLNLKQFIITRMSYTLRCVRFSLCCAVNHN